MAIVILIFIGTALLLPTGFMFGAAVWCDSMNQRDVTLNSISVGIFTSITLFWCFWLGRKGLFNAGTVLANIFSVVSVPIIVSFAVLVLWAWGRPFEIFATILIASIHPSSATLSFYFGLERSSSYMLMSLLPSVALWIGVISKKHANDESPHECHKGS